MKPFNISLLSPSPSLCSTKSASPALPELACLLVFSWKTRIQMMASDSNAKAGTKGSGCGGGGTGAAAGLLPPEQGLNCPRCDSLNTKFCYYNNYSLAQPRHFCKSCRRYWTKGGALRNVPVGGGCRKNRKSKSCSASAASSSSSSSSLSHLTNYLEPSKSIASMDFHFSSLFPFSLTATASTTATASMAAGRMSGSYSNMASSIESLSSINQDLHWRLQQQRMQLLLGGDNEPHRKDLRVVSFAENQVEPICFAVAENNKGENFLDSSASNETHKSSDTGTAWFLDGSFATPAPPSSSAINPADDASMNFSAPVSDWNGFTAAWSDEQHFTSLP